MKKKIFIALAVLLIVGLGAGYIYLDKILTSIVISTLNSQYGLRVEMENLTLGAVPGWVTLNNPHVYDARSQANSELASAEDIQLSVHPTKILSGQVEMKELRSTALAVHIEEQDDQSLNWSSVIPRFIAQAETQPQPKAQQQETAVEASSEAAKIPALSFQNLQLNYTGKSKDALNKYNITLGELKHDPSEQLLSVSQFSTSRNQETVASIETASVHNVMGGSGKIHLNAGGVMLTAQEQANGNYNCGDVVDAWLSVFTKIQKLLPASNENSSEKQDIPVGDIVVSNVRFHILPVEVEPNTEGAIAFQLNRMEYKTASGDIIISGLLMREAGEPAVTVDTLTMNYDMDTHTVKSVASQGLNIDIRENAEGVFNFNRAINRIQDVIESLIPKPEQQTAQASSFETTIPASIHFNKSLITYHKQDGNNHSMKWDGLTYSQESNQVTFTGTRMGRITPDKTEWIYIPTVTAVPVKDKQFSEWDSLLIENMKSSLKMKKEGLDLTPVIQDWIAFSSSFTSKSDSSASSSSKMPFRTIQISNADIKYTDLRQEPYITHHLSPVTVLWKNQDNQTASLSWNSDIIAPGKGKLVFQGTSSQNLAPLNLNGKPELTIENLPAYESFYQGKMPVKIDKGGLRLEGNVAINDNQLDSNFDIFLLQPKFSVSTGNLPIQIDGRAAVSTLNSLKDKNGVIAFRGNRLAGDITNPQFSFGTSIANILVQSIFKQGLNILSLPKNIAEEGVGVIKEGAGKVGKVLDGILNIGNN